MYIHILLLLPIVQVMVVGNFLHELRFRCKVAVGLHGTRCVSSMFRVVLICRLLVLRLRRFRMVLLSSVQFSCDMTSLNCVCLSFDKWCKCVCSPCCDP